ncbi:MAG: family 43 glycosylhydrolase [Clostridiales bacterium]|nr:family 43 glycosylhydrolase [Clostridiales bacterium]
MSRIFITLFLFPLLSLSQSISAATPSDAHAKHHMPRFDSICPDIHDPVMALDNGTYYIYSTGMGLGLISSTDLKTWKREPSPLNPLPAWALKSIKAYNGHTWAPDIIKAGDRWYLYYSCSTFGKNISAIGVATSKSIDPASPDCHWEDLGPVIESRPGVNDWNAIDPNVIFDNEGKPWLTFGSFWDGIQLVRLDKDMKTVTSSPKTIARRRVPAASTYFPKKVKANPIEAPFIIFKDGYYYLFVSHDYCCKGLRSNYKIAVGRSRDIEGPYLDMHGKDMALAGGTTLAMPDEAYAGIGHCSVYNFDGQWYIVAHAYDRSKNGASKLFLKKLEWSNGWPGISPLSTDR